MFNLKCFEENACYAPKNRDTKSKVYFQVELHRSVMSEINHFNKSSLYLETKCESNDAEYNLFNSVHINVGNINKTFDLSDEYFSSLEGEKSLFNIPFLSLINNNMKLCQDLNSIGLINSLQYNLPGLRNVNCAESLTIPHKFINITLYLNENIKAPMKNFMFSLHKTVYNIDTPMKIINPPHYLEYEEPMPINKDAYQYKNTSIRPDENVMFVMFGFKDEHNEFVNVNVKNYMFRLHGTNYLSRYYDSSLSNTYADQQINKKIYIENVDREYCNSAQKIIDSPYTFCIDTRYKKENHESNDILLTVYFDKPLQKEVKLYMIVVRKFD